MGTREKMEITGKLMSFINLERVYGYDYSHTINKLLKKLRGGK